MGFFIAWGFLLVLHGFFYCLLGNLHSYGKTLPSSILGMLELAQLHRGEGCASSQGAVAAECLWNPDQECHNSAYSLIEADSLAASMPGGLLCHLKTTAVPFALDSSRLSLSPRLPGTTLAASLPSPSLALGPQLLSIIQCLPESLHRPILLVGTCKMLPP